MKTAAALSLAFASVALAQLNPGDISRSASGQFIVSSQAGDLRRVPPALGTNINFLRLEPTFTAVSAERTKQTLNRLLDATDAWELPVTITLRRPRTADDPVTVTAGYLGTRRACHVQLPAVVSPERYLHALTEVIVLEAALRKATESTVEIPAWLTEGLAYHLQCNHATELLLTAPTKQDNGLPLNRTQLEFRRVSSLEKAHKILVGTAPLSFEELSWPTSDQLQGSRHDFYRASAQVFVVSLLRLPDGPACLRKFVVALPAYQNWQLAFLAAFELHFKRPLDVEKWWSLEGLNFAGRDLTQTWPVAESWDKLDAVLTETVDVFTSTNALPARTQWSLAEMIERWSADQQSEALDRKRTQLRELQLRIAPELHPLTANYVGALNDFLSMRGLATTQEGLGRIGGNSARYAELKLLRRLDALEAERAKLRPGATKPDAAAALNTAAGLREMRLPAPALRAN